MLILEKKKSTKHREQASILKSKKKSKLIKPKISRRKEIIESRKEVNNRNR